MHRYRSPALFLLAVLAPALYMVNLRFGGATQNPDATLLALLQGEAATPFQYRALAPWLLRGLRALFALEPAHLGALAQSWELAMLLGLALVTRAYLRTMVAAPVADAAAFAVFYAYPFLYAFTALSRYYYPSDTLSIVLFTAGLLALRLQRWAWFAALVALGTFNRETALFLVFAYALTAAPTTPRRQLWLGIGGLGLLWLAVKLCLLWLYRDNPGAGIVWADAEAVSTLPQSFASSRLAANLADLANPRGLLTLLGALGFLWIPMVVWWRKIPDAFVRRAAWVTVPFLGVMALVGNALEMRIYGELLPLWLACAATALQGRERMQGAALHPQGGSPP